MDSNVHVRLSCLNDGCHGCLACLECRFLNYGYGCNESCACTYGRCNPNATRASDSCVCNLGYQGLACSKLINVCCKWRIGGAGDVPSCRSSSVLNSSCNPTTEDCRSNPIDGTSTCTCKLGYERNATTRECAGRTDALVCTCSLSAMPRHQ